MTGTMTTFVHIEEYLADHWMLLSTSYIIKLPAYIIRLSPIPVTLLTPLMAIMGLNPNLSSILNKK